ncbi:Ubiquitin domain-containing protein DSK2a, partial [Dictyocoela roeselum]
RMCARMPGMTEQLEKNPELRMMLNNPQLYEEMERIADDPGYMREQLKNVDLAMQKLGNMPGGLNMMNSMMQDLRDPFTVAMDGSSHMNIKALKENKGMEKDGKLGDNMVQPDGPLPNPWGTKRKNYVVIYRDQLEVLRECGFTDLSRNIETLRRTDGDVDLAMIELAEQNEQN